MRRLLKYFIFALLLGGGFLWLRGHDGVISVAWLGWRADIRMVFALPALAAGLFLLWMVDHLLRWLLRLPEKFARQRKERKRARGYECLLDGFTAIAASDVGAARKLSREAEKLFRAADREVLPLALMLAAQTEQMDDHHDEANRYYQEMLTHASAEFLGLRGLLVGALRRLPHEPEQLHDATRLAERAYKLRPGTSWVVTTLLELYHREGRWEEGEKLIRRARRTRTLAAIDADRLLAIVHYQRAERLHREGRLHEALAQVEKAHKERLAFVPATGLMARVLEESGARGKAIRLIERSWEHQPHPELLEWYRRLTEEEGPEKRLKQVQRLVRRIPEHVESRLAVAAAALEAGEFGQARAELDAALAARETVRACRLMAALEEAERRGPQADAWRARMMAAQPDARWICEECHAPQERWQAICLNCGAFDHVRWQVPGEALRSAAGEPVLLGAV